MSSPNAHAQTVALDDLYTALGAVSAEVIHEIAHTLLFLRQLANLAGGSTGAAQEVMTFAGQEIARLERLLGNLRRFKGSTSQRGSVPLLATVQPILVSLTGSTDGSPRCEVDVPSTLTLSEDPALVAQALRNLLEHARDMAGASGTFGIRASASQAAGSGALSLQVWDSGPEVPAAARSSLFLPWQTRENNHPLRLAIVRSLVRGFGWTLTYKCSADCNEYHLSVPKTAVEVP
jgi:signal transduction histidine kinase